MNNKVLLSFIKNKNDLKKKLEEIKRSIKNEIVTKWHSYLPIPKEDNWIAIDGSYNYVKFRSIVLYALNVSCVLYCNSKIQTENYPEFDVVEDHLFIEDFLRYKMIKKELEIASKYSEEFNVMLDGSLSFFLTYLSNEEKSEILNKFKKTNKNIVSISKTFSSIFSEDVDIGFSDFIKIQKNPDFFSFYFKLRKDSLIFKAETINQNKLDIEDIIAKLRFFEVRGYPYLLKKAHNEAKISNKDMEKFVKILRIKEKTGREVL